jgi:hypothetical protein
VRMRCYIAQSSDDMVHAYRRSSDFGLGHPSMVHIWRDVASPVDRSHSFVFGRL